MASSSRRDREHGLQQPPPSGVTSGVVKAIAGAGAALTSTILCSPLDVAKTRIQVQSALGSGSAKYQGTLQSLAVIYREEGLRGWFAGLTPALCSVCIFWMCYFPTYDYSKVRLAEAAGLQESSSLVHMAAAAASGCLTDVVTNPLWLVRTRLATESLRRASDEAGKRVSRPVEYRSMAHAFRKIAREEGLLSFYNGLSASLIGLSHIIIQFPLYEKLKSDPALQQLHGDSHVMHIATASALSKLVASSITYPHEVLRARLQFDRKGELYSGIGDALRKTIRADGLCGLWQGFRLNIVRTVPQCVITFTVYEWLQERLHTALAREQHRHTHQPPDFKHVLTRTRSESR